MSRAPFATMSTMSSRKTLLKFVTTRPEKLKTRTDVAVRATRHGAATTTVSFEYAGVALSGTTTHP